MALLVVPLGVTDVVVLCGSIWFRVSSMGSQILARAQVFLCRCECLNLMEGYVERHAITSAVATSSQSQHIMLLE